MTHWEMSLQTPKRFLIIEDEKDIADLVRLHLADLNADISVSNEGPAGLYRATHEHWDCIVLDLQLPGLDGLDICRQLRSREDYVPILMLTSRTTELDRVLGLEIGADDYMPKPFSVIELKSRIKALLRRSSQVNADISNQPVVQIGALRIDLDRRQAKLSGRSLDLTAKEFDLLWFFANHPGRVFKRLELLDQVWGYGHEGYEHTVNSHINRLRAKLEPDPATPQYIHTIWGVGYRFRE